MGRAAHAVAHEGRVWVLDPFDAPEAEERVRALGEPAAVVQLLDRHGRDCAAWAERLGVPLHVLPRDLPGSPWRVIPIPALPGWKEAALWSPALATLVCADALASSAGYAGPGLPVGVHPFLRLRPPRDLAGLPVRHLLLGHGAGIHGPEAEAAVDDALATARSGIPGYAVAMVRRALPF